MTQRVLRIDRVALPKAERLDSGAVRAPARLTRTGVFAYTLPDGSTVRELRLPEEVFKADSIASFEILPLTDGHHPEIDQGDVNTRNARNLAVGACAGIKQDVSDPQYLSATVSVWDQRMIEKIDRGTQELSCGYYCDREQAPKGSVYKNPITGDSEPYDLIQRNIRGNHVAILPVGRAGPGARILMDGQDESAAIRLDHKGNQIPTTKENRTMEKITIDGVDFEVSTQAKQAVLKSVAGIQAEASKLKANLDTAQGERDALAGQVSKLTADLAAATDPKAIQARINERMEIERIGTAHGIKADGLDMDGIKRAVVAKLAPSVKLDGMSADYVAGVFATTIATKGQSVAAAIGAQIPAVQVAKLDTSGKSPAQAARDRFFAQGQAEVKA